MADIDEPPPRRVAIRRKLRRAGRAVLPLHERQLVVFCIAAVVVGLIAALFSTGVAWATGMFVHITAARPWLPFVLCPLGLGAIVFLTRKVFPGAQGSGIPQAIAGLRMADPRQVDRFLSWRIAIGKILLTLAGFLCGASIGKEGPIVQIGCSVMNNLGRIGLPRTAGLQRLLILAGGAAGIASAFNAPLAGAVFAIEEMAHQFDSKIARAVLPAALLSGLTLFAVFGAHSYFGSTQATLPLGAGWLAVPVCGILGGLFGGAFAQVLVTPMRFLPRFVGGFALRHPVPFAVFCGLVLACLGTLSGGMVFDASYAPARAALHGTLLLPASFAFLKWAATMVSYLSGIPGGLFAPSLAVGVGVGAVFSHIFPALPVGAIAMIGMAGYFAGVVQSPLTAAVIVVEMTSDPAMTVAVGLAAVIGSFSSKLVCPKPIYAAMADQFFAAVAGPDHGRSATAAHAG